MQQANGAVLEVLRASGSSTPEASKGSYLKKIDDLGPIQTLRECLGEGPSVACPHSAATTETTVGILRSR
ncbi:hypothetical protein GGE07_006165 [Sinorhizobium terangae]|nr:hypothetical protein [Sinorhizobium terangae]